MKKKKQTKLTGNERTVKNIVLRLIRHGCPPNQISISGGQNPRLRKWAEKKGVVWNWEQECDIIFPNEFSMVD